MARALVKVASYCDYRAKTEQGMIEKPAVETDLHLAEQLEKGYPGFLSAFASDGDSMKGEVIHPFDTHPPMADRIRKLGFDVAEILRNVELQTRPQRTWRDAILPAAALEAGLWARREQDLQNYHSVAIAYRVLPETAEEIAAVERHFPRVVLRNAKGETAALDYRSLRLASWDHEIPFTDITSLRLDDSWGKKRLTITHKLAEPGKTGKEKLIPLAFLGDEGNLLQLLEKYYGRHQAARAQVSG